jgi:hypothetical protein
MINEAITTSFHILFQFIIFYIQLFDAIYSVFLTELLSKLQIYKNFWEELIAYFL